MATRLGNAVQTYKNHGAKAVVIKAKQKTKKGIKRIVSPKRYSFDEKELHKEYSLLSNPVFQVSEEDIKISNSVKGEAKDEINTATWFIPYFNHLAFGGIQTIFRFVEKLSKEGVKNNIVIYDKPNVDVKKIRTELNSHFPKLVDYDITVLGEDKIREVENLPQSDIAFCTMWVSAYFLLRFNQTSKKYYFIQDYEPLFYVAGSTYALAESTYRFGFKGIVNTPGLLASVNQRHGQEGVSFVPSVNTEVYYPDPNRNNKKVRIFFYARPSNPRNAFNLGVLTIKNLIDKYGDSIEIITAGAAWDEREYGLKNLIINKGLIGTIAEVAELYRSCDIGFSFMMNKHTSYQMLEYAASGVATVINRNEDHGWLYKDGINCLIAEPSPKDMAEKIGDLIDDSELRERLVTEAQKELAYSWDQQTDAIWNDIKNN